MVAFSVLFSDDADPVLDWRRLQGVCGGTPARLRADRRIMMADDADSIMRAWRTLLHGRPDTGRYADHMMRIYNPAGDRSTALRIMKDLLMEGYWHGGSPKEADFDTKPAWYDRLDDGRTLSIICGISSSPDSLKRDRSLPYDRKRQRESSSMTMMARFQSDLTMPSPSSHTITARRRADTSSAPTPPACSALQRLTRRAHTGCRSPRLKSSGK